MNIEIEDIPIQRQTEKDGQCFIEGLEGGTYTLRVSFIGYYTIRFANVSVVRNTITKLVAKLEMETGMRGIETIDARRVQVIEKQSN